MANEIDALLARVDDAALRGDLKTQFDRLRQKRQFGLVFEEHLPERVTLPHHPIRRGTKVVARDDDGVEPRSVIAVTSGLATLPTVDGVTEEVSTETLVAVAEFGEPIYPGLKSLGSMDRGGDKPAHVVIKGENHHALEALQFTHAGKVDCIYIDPPYNTGDRDWKYNNDYVDKDDAYRHSKWLAFMQRRLELAKDLLNPDDSILIAAIDEREHLRLGLLIEQTFSGSDMQVINIVTNQAGSSRVGRMTRTDEYLFVVFIGNATVAASPHLAEGEGKMPTVWFSATRNGEGNALRKNRTTPVLFYPVHIDATSGAFHSVGPPLDQEVDRHEYESPQGTIAIWPLSKQGREQTWRFDGASMRKFFAEGTARLGRRDPQSGHRPITYLQPGTLALIEDGTYEVTRRTSEGDLVLALGPGAAKPTAPTTSWSLGRHFAREYGSKLNSALLPDRRFPYPKSLYAVEDALRIAVEPKPHALVLDFFGGSGTTTHAVCRLNHLDGGTRQSIVVTNNEVSADEADELREKGWSPGQPQFEEKGIFEYIARPRIEAAISGRTPDGSPVRGEYKFVDEFPMSEGFEENVEFVELTYLDAEDIELDIAFAGIAPMLWMRAGSSGPIIEERTDAQGEPVAFAATDVYAVLFDPDQWRNFLEKLPGTVTTVFVVTDSASVFAGVAGELPDGLDVIRLYENYLATFAINQGGRR